ncbi:MAG: bifunctional fucokinase/fucose-1-phosphate guanylyltransferase [Verrucomicrobiota bacterium]
MTTSQNPFPIQYLLTLPPRMAAEFEELEQRRRPEWFAASDPPGHSLGSGGGTASLLAQAWRHTAPEQSFDDWLSSSRKLILHAGGQSRRLPAYALVGKLLMPIPVFRWARGQRLDQTLLDLQLPDYQRVLAHAPPAFAAMITSGDVLLRFARELPPFPEVDMLGLGMWLAPERACDFGVFCAPRGHPSQLAFCLQKPSADKIRQLAENYLCLVDTGMWLLSARAVRVLMEHCGWSAQKSQFRGGAPAPYELYSHFGLALGQSPAVRDDAINALTCAVVPLPEAQFYHFGASAQMIDSVSVLQNLVLDATKIGLAGGRRHPDQITQNSLVSAHVQREHNHTLWIDNSVIPASWQLASNHVLTGVPDNLWPLRLEPGVCLDFIPVGERDFCLRAYGFRDTFSGDWLDASTWLGRRCASLGQGKLGKWLDASTWLGRPVIEWFNARGFHPKECGLDWALDIQRWPLFPVCQPADLEPAYLTWLFAAKPENRPDFVKRWRESARLSAQELGSHVNLHRLYASRAQLRSACLLPLMKNFRWSVFFQLDLESTARAFAATKETLPDLPFDPQDDPMQLLHDQMFRSAVLRLRSDPAWEKFEAAAFARLRDMIAREAQLSPASPSRNVLDDQIVWARSPVRLDLAGGWTDTPPYCIEYGGNVLNVAVDINGQPPVQVFAKLSDRPELVLRSIDLGVEEHVTTYAELETFAQPGNPFALAKAAFALAGFLPRFHSAGGFTSLAAQLADFGGGIELSLLAAAPKGSGLGTSSILAATVLAALSDLCGLGWDRNVLFVRTLALEQMLTTGGGWQD